MPTLRAVVVEDDIDDAELLILHLQQAGYDVTWSRVESESSFKEAMETAPDIIFSDYSLPRLTGLRVLELLRSSARDVPLILLSGSVGEEAAVEAMQLGATDFLLKERIFRLPSAVYRALNEWHLRRDREKSREALRDAHQRLRSIFNHSLDCIAVISAKGEVTEMNRAGLAILQADTMSDVISRPLTDFVVQEYQLLLSDAHERVMDKKTARIEFEALGHRGRRLWFEMQAGPLTNSADQVEAAICVIRDVSDRKHAEAQIRQQLEELQRWQVVTVGREDRIVTLKAEVNGLLQELGRPARYSSAHRDPPPTP